MPIATVKATSRTSTFSRQAALGYGLSHLLAAVSSFSICFSNVSLSAPLATAPFNSAVAALIASTAWAERMSRWWLRIFWTCLRMAVAWRTRLERNHRIIKSGEWRVASDEGGKTGPRQSSCFQDLDEGLLRDVDRAEGFHAPLARVSLFQEVAFSGCGAGVS